MSSKAIIKKAVWLCILDLLSSDLDDLKSLIETMLLITALLLSFAFAGMQALDHDKLLEADARFLRLRGNPTFNHDVITQCTQGDSEAIWMTGDARSWDACNKSLEDYFARQRESKDGYRSYRYLEQNMLTLGNFLVVLLLGMMMYISIVVISKSIPSSEYPLLRRFWILPYYGGIIWGYYLVLKGIVLLFEANHVFADLTLPLYSGNFSVNFDGVTGQMVEGGWWMLQSEYVKRKNVIMESLITIALTVMVLHVFLHVSASIFSAACKLVSNDLPDIDKWFHNSDLEPIFDLPIEELTSSQRLKYVIILQHEEISQQQLCDLSPEVLRSFGIPYGHALKIVEHLKRPTEVP